MVANSSVERIRVLVADDSAVMRSAVSRLLQSDPEIQVVGIAKDGLNAVQQVAALDPDVVTLDLEMPVMDGLAALKRIMGESPRPVIMFSSLTVEGAEATFDALALGAFDYVPKPTGYATVATVRDELVAKVKAAYASRARRRTATRTQPVPAVMPLTKTPVAELQGNVSLVCVGCSTGGPAALQRILPMLPGEFPVPVVVVQHMPPGFTEPFARRLNGLCSLRVQEALPGQSLESGTVSIAPAGWQLTIGRRGARLAVNLSKEPVLLHRPSVDVMMLSAAETCGSRALGVILTGMGSDGQHGMGALYSSGAMTIGQDEHSCAVYGMPRACAEQGTLHHVLPLDEIPRELMRALRVPAAR